MFVNNKKSFEKQQHKVKKGMTASLTFNNELTSSELIKQQAKLSDEEYFRRVLKCSQLHFRWVHRSFSGHQNFFQDQLIHRRHERTLSIHHQRDYYLSSSHNQKTLYDEGQS